MTRAFRSSRAGGPQARHATLDTYLTAALALVQGALFVAWRAYWTHFVI
ncbi:hypothetical protein AB0H63_18105 [Micromonospora echinospora]